MMRLEAGPVEFGPEPEIEAWPERPSFEALALEEAEWIEAYLGESEADLVSAFNHTDQNYPAFIDASLMEAADAINQQLGWTPDVTLEGAATAEPEMITAIVEAYGQVPAEGWEAVPRPFVPPPETTEWWPLDEDGYAPEPGGPEPPNLEQLP